MFCSKCGAQLTEGTAFCSACGQPVAGLPAAVAAPAGYATPAMAPAGGLPVYNNLPAAIALPSPYAGFWLRVIAHFIDGIVLMVVFGILLLIGIAFVGIGALRQAAESVQQSDPEFPIAIIGLFIVVGIAAVIASWIYYAYSESSVIKERWGKWRWA